MILCDANLLLYAYNVDSADHAKAKEWLEGELSSPSLFYLSWQTITAFIRISTNHRAFPRPLSIEEAVKIVSSWLERPQCRVLTETEQHWEIFAGLLATEKAVGPLVMDAHLAALAVEHGTTLATTDRDFARFSGLKIINPLAS
jgi:toxin-antitoxin system PIN domain toxin